MWSFGLWHLVGTYKHLGDNGSVHGSFHGTPVWASLAPIFPAPFTFHTPLYSLQSLFWVLLYLPLATYATLHLPSLANMAIFMASISYFPIFLLVLSGFLTRTTAKSYFACIAHSASFLLVAYLAYSLSSKIEAIYSPEMSVKF